MVNGQAGWGPESDNLRFTEVSTFSCPQRFWEGVSASQCTNVGQVTTETQICGLKLDLMVYYQILLSVIPKTQVDYTAIDFFFQASGSYGKIKVYAILMADKWSMKCQWTSGHHKLLLTLVFILIRINDCEQWDYYQANTRPVFSNFDRSISTLETLSIFSFVYPFLPKRDFNSPWWTPEFLRGLDHSVLTSLQE